MNAVHSARHAIAVVLLAVLCACSRLDTSPPEQPDSHAVTIMTFNAENLFDNQDDPDRNDFTFLPKSAKQSVEHVDSCNKINVNHWRDQCLNWDWSDDTVDAKLRATAAVILQVNDGRGPDVIALQEIENASILERLRTEYLTSADYGPAILLEGHDIRGIDVAFLSRLPIEGPPTLHGYPKDGYDLSRRGDTRGVLQATFRLPDGSLLTGFSVHFPAPYHPTEMRVIAYEQLNALRTSLPDDHYAFAAGDFNTTSREDSEKNMLGRFARPTWTVTHDEGCGDCRGSYYYGRDDSWSFLDMILWSPAVRRGENATWRISADSVHLADGASGQLHENGTPRTFDIHDASGASDHLPVVVTIETE